MKPLYIAVLAVAILGAGAVFASQYSVIFDDVDTQEAIIVPVSQRNVEHQAMGASTNIECVDDGELNDGATTYVRHVFYTNSEGNSVKTDEYVLGDVETRGGIIKSVDVVSYARMSGYDVTPNTETYAQVYLGLEDEYKLAVNGLKESHLRPGYTEYRVSFDSDGDGNPWTWDKLTSSEIGVRSDIYIEDSGASEVRITNCFVVVNYEV